MHALKEKKRPTFSEYRTLFAQKTTSDFEEFFSFSITKHRAQPHGFSKKNKCIRNKKTKLRKQRCLNNQYNKTDNIQNHNSEFHCYKRAHDTLATVTVTATLATVADWPQRAHSAVTLPNRDNNSNDCKIKYIIIHITTVILVKFERDHSTPLIVPLVLFIKALSWVISFSASSFSSPSVTENPFEPRSTLVKNKNQIKNFNYTFHLATTITLTISYSTDMSAITFRQPSFVEKKIFKMNHLFYWFMLDLYLKTY